MRTLSRRRSTSRSAGNLEAFFSVYVNERKAAEPQSERLLNLQRCLVYYHKDLFYYVTALKPFTRKQLHTHMTGPKNDLNIQNNFSMQRKRNCSIIKTESTCQARQSSLALIENQENTTKIIFCFFFLSQKLLFTSDEAEAAGREMMKGSSPPAVPLGNGRRCVQGCGGF